VREILIMAKRVPKIRSITVLGRRWFQRGPGNTYSSVTILINGKEGVKLGMEYGYGDHYEQRACDWLVNGPLGPDLHRDVRNVKEYCRLNKIAYYAEVVDVPRERDLVTG
jgi:hypothetical protein